MNSLEGEVNAPDMRTETAMRRRVTAIIFAVALGAVAGAARAASPFDAAVAAYQQGDFDRARLLWEQALSQGDWEAARSLGTLYRRGLGVPADPARAAGYYEKAAAHGVVAAEVNLAEMYIAGLGVKRDIGAAKRLLADAALHGNVPAQGRLRQIDEAEKRGEPPPPLN